MRRIEDAGTCLTCGRQMRSVRGPWVEDTVARKHEGLCNTCFARTIFVHAPGHGDTPYVDAGTCLVCGVTMRRRGEKMSDHPGTEIRAYTDICRPCKRFLGSRVPEGRVPKSTAAKTRSSSPVMDGGADPNTISGLMSFLARRRNRPNTNPNGVLYEGEVS